MKFRLTSGTSYSHGHGYGNGDGCGDGCGDDYGDGYGDGCAQVNSGIHPVVSADEDVIVAIRTATLRGLTHIDT